MPSQTAGILAQNLDVLLDYDQEVLSLIVARHDHMIEKVISWARINTGSWNTDGLVQFSKVLAEDMQSLDADVDVIPLDPIEKISSDGSVEYKQTGPLIRVTARPNAPLQIVCTGHYDTVFPKGTFDEVQPIKDGRINGPGVADMKGGILVILEAIKAFDAGPLKDNIGYQIILSPDEETGNFASRGYLEAAARGAHIGLTFEPAMETGAMSGARKGSAIFDITFKGKASHAGRAPEAGCSAIYAAAEFVSKVEALEQGVEGVTFNVGCIDGGGAVNIVPDLAVVRLGVRAPDKPAADWATAQIKKIYDETLNRDGISGEFHGGFYRPPKPRNAAQEALFNVTRLTGNALGLNLTFVDTGGVCEGNNVFAAGTPNIDTLGVRGGRIHSSDEFAVVDSFVERASLAALLFNRIADGRIDAPLIKSLMNKD